MPRAGYDDPSRRAHLFPSGQPRSAVLKVLRPQDVVPDPRLGHLMCDHKCPRLSLRKCSGKGDRRQLRTSHFAIDHVRSCCSAGARVL